MEKTVLVCSLINPMNAKKINISISLPGPLRDQVRLAARDDDRSVSGLVCSLLRSYLRREGYCVSVSVNGKGNGYGYGKVNGNGFLGVGAARPRQTCLKYFKVRQVSNFDFKKT